MTELLDYKSPCGWLRLVAEGEELQRLDFIKSGKATNKGNKFLNLAKQQLDEFFRGERTTFSIPYTLSGTDFQQQVWRALTKIKYGETVSYKTIATWIKNPRAVRAVGNANNKNPLSIIIPCHRVIGTNGGLVGYGGGLDNKEWLLELEKESVALK